MERVIAFVIAAGICEASHIVPGSDIPAVNVNPANLTVSDFNNSCARATVRECFVVHCYEASLNCVCYNIQTVDDNGSDDVALLPTFILQVSGLSSGAFMAIQLQTSWSSTIYGVAALAGGPFWCAQDDVALALSECMKHGDLISVSELALIMVNTAASGFIDELKVKKDVSVVCRFRLLLLFDYSVPCRIWSALVCGCSRLNRIQRSSLQW
jgi:hypothetical protein